MKGSNNQEMGKSICSIHPEVMSIVFKMYIDDVEWEDTMTAVPTLSSVCRNWFNIVHNGAQFWTKIAIPFQEKYPQKLLLAIERWLSRSKKLPLSVHLYTSSDDDFDPSKSKSFLKFFKLLQKSSNRWRDLSLAMPTTLIRFLFTKSGNRQYLEISNVRFIRLDLPEDDALMEYGDSEREEDDSDGSDDRKDNPLWASSPTPLSLDLSWRTKEVERRLPLNFATYNIDWDRLTSLRIENAMARDCFMAMQAAPQLKDFTMVSCFELESTVMPPVAWLVHDLEHLCFKKCRPNTADILGYIAEFPKLKTFSLDGLYAKYGECQIVTVMNLLDSVPSLEYLEIPINIFANQDHLFEEIIKLTGELPTLKHLRIAGFVHNQDDSDEPRANQKPVEYPMIIQRLLRRLAETADLELGDSSSEIPFPSLEILEYTQNKFLPYTYWNLVPGAFGTLTKIGTPDRRPLRSIILSESPTEEEFLKLVPARRAGANFGTQVNSDIDLVLRN